MAAETLKFGDLLVKLNLISEMDLDDALQVAPQFGLPLGRTLVLSGRLSEQELQVVVELQPLINQQDYPLDSAKQIVALVRSGISPTIAMKNVRAASPAEKTVLGELLVESGVITRPQMEEAQKLSYQSGMRLGRILVLSNVISAEQLKAALSAQLMLRERTVARDKALQMVKAVPPAKPALVQPNKTPAAMEKRSVKFTEFLVLSGLATEAEMLNALETSLNRGLSLGETVIDMGIVSKRVFDTAIELYTRVSGGDMALKDATDQVHKMVFGDPTHDKGRHSPVLGELLKMGGFITDHDIEEAIALANKYPAIIGKMLVLSGAIDEATLIASLRCQFLLKNGYLKLDQGIAALERCKTRKMSFDDALEEMGLRKYQHVLELE